MKERSPVGWFSGRKPSAPAAQAPQPVESEVRHQPVPGEASLQWADDLYLHGQLADAVPLWQKAADRGNTDAMLRLGFAAMESGDDTRGASWFVRATGLEGDAALTEAMSRTVAAVQAGDVNAITQYGIQLARAGQTLAADGFLTQAAEAGQVHAMWWLCVVRGPEEGLRSGWFKKAVEGRHPQALALLAAVRENTDS
jgi:TPR repeat protein